jgi:phosphotransacetylase
LVGEGRAELLMKGSLHTDELISVAGDPDILLAPDLEAGNILAKQLSFLANADSAGLVVGARVPILLTSRADSVRSRIARCAVAMLAAHGLRRKAARHLSG